MDGIKHFCNIVYTVQQTIGIQREIDDIYPEVEKNLCKLHIDDK